MRKAFKVTLIVISVLSVLIVAGGYVALTVIRKAFGTDCKSKNTWTIKEYKIQEFKCVGWAGPNYYPLHLYKNDKKINERGHKIDSCTIEFSSARDVYFKFNVCEDSFVELRPEKIPLVLEIIDSVIVHRTEPSQIKMLDQNEIIEFVRKWNEAPVFDFRNNNEKPFYPKASYIVFVYTHGKVREFETGNFMIKESDNWSYNFLEEGEEIGYRKFDEMWSR